MRQTLLTEGLRIFYVRLRAIFLWVRAITNGLKAPAKINFPFIKRPYTKEEKENADHGEDCRTDNSGYDCAEALFRHLSGRSAIAQLSD